MTHSLFVASHQKAAALIGFALVAALQFEARAEFIKHAGQHVAVAEYRSSPENTEYLVDVLDSSQVFAFAISTGQVPNSPGGGVFNAGNSRTPVWYSRLLTRAEWNSGVDYPFGTATHNTLALGTFDELFINSDPGVVLYSVGESGLPISEGNDHNEATWPASNPISLGSNVFWVATAAASDFIAIGANGRIIDSSAAVVPEPSAFLLFGVAGGWLALTRASRNRTPKKSSPC